jgi:hypothetical protein
MTNVFCIIVGGLLVLAGCGERSGALAGAGCIILAIGLASDRICGSLAASKESTVAVEKAIRDIEAQVRWMNEYTIMCERREHPEAEEALATTRQQEKSE